MNLHFNRNDNDDDNDDDDEVNNDDEDVSKMMLVMNRVTIIIHTHGDSNTMIMLESYSDDGHDVNYE